MKTRKGDEIETSGASDCPSGECEALTNVFTLNPATTALFDNLWRQAKQETEPVSFIQCCQRLCHGTRFRTAVFRSLPKEMYVWPGWKQVTTQFRDHLPEFQGMLEYVVRRIFKALFKKDSNKMFEWFIEGCVTKTRLTEVLIETLQSATQGSTEKRVLQAVLHSSFTRADLKPLRKQHASLFEELDREASTEDPEKTPRSDEPTQASTTGPRVEQPLAQRREPLDEEILDVPESNDDGTEEDDDDDSRVDCSEDEDGDVMDDIFRRIDSRAVRNGNRSVDGDPRASLQPRQDMRRRHQENEGKYGNFQRRLDLNDIDEYSDHDRQDRRNRAIVEKCTDVADGNAIRHGSRGSNEHHGDSLEEHGAEGEQVGLQSELPRKEHRDGSNTDRSQTAAEQCHEVEGEDDVNNGDGVEFIISNRGNHNDACRQPVHRVMEVGGTERNENGAGQGSQLEMSNGNGVERRVIESGTNRSKKNATEGRSSVSGWRHWNARKDLKLLIDTGNIVGEKRSRKHFEDETLRETVQYILQSNNIQLLSWGTRRVIVDAEWRQFPVLVRKVIIDVLWRNYARDRCNFPSGVKKVRRTLFCDIASKLTRGDTKQRACIDYKLHGLVYENMNLLRRVIDDHVRDTNKRKLLKKKLKGVSEYLKYSFITHLQEGSTDPFHNVKFSLGHGTFDAGKMKGQCLECNAVYKVLEELKAEIIDSPPGLDDVMRNAAKKFEVFMGHIVRKHVQERAIGRVFEWIRDGEANKRVVIYVDFKMKVEPQRFRESTLQYYGKAGMSLHGAAAYYLPDKTCDKDYLERMLKYSDEHVRDGGKRRLINDIEEAERKLNEDRLSMFFIDHVIENDKKQDVPLTASIIDAICYRVKLQLPAASEVVFISDNARNYNNDFLPILLPKICESHNLLLRSYLHPDACCGKSCVDGHFAVQWRHLKRYIEETESDVVTPEDIMDALTYDGGVKNTVVDYLKINRRHETFLKVKLSEELRMVERLGSPAEIKYVRGEGGKYFLNCYKYSGCQFERIVVDGFESMIDRNYVYADSIDKPEPPPIPIETEVDPKTGQPKQPKGPVTEATILRGSKEFSEIVTQGRLGESVKVRRRSRSKKVGGKVTARKGSKNNEEGRNCEVENGRQHGYQPRQQGDQSDNDGVSREVIRAEMDTGSVMEDEQDMERLDGDNSVEHGDVPVELSDCEDDHCDKEDEIGNGEEENPGAPIGNGEEDNPGPPGSTVEAAQPIKTVTNMTNDVLARRLSCGRKNYYLMNPIVTCIMTGVQVKYLSGIHYWRRKTYISAKTPFEDTNEEMNFVLTGAVQDENGDCDGDEERVSTDGTGSCVQQEEGRRIDNAMPEQLAADEDCSERNVPVAESVSATVTDTISGELIQAPLPQPISQPNRQPLPQPQSEPPRDPLPDAATVMGAAVRAVETVSASTAYPVQRDAEEISGRMEHTAEGYLDGEQRNESASVVAEQPLATERMSESARNNDVDDDGDVLHRVGNKRRKGRNEAAKSKPVKRLKDGFMYTCTKCSLRYKVKKSFDEHIDTCSIDAVVGSSIQRAVTFAYGMIYLDKSVE